MQISASRSACGMEAKAYHDGEGVAKDDLTAARALAQKGCDKNDALACALLSLA